MFFIYILAGLITTEKTSGFFPNSFNKSLEPSFDGLELNQIPTPKTITTAKEIKYTNLLPCRSPVYPWSLESDLKTYRMGKRKM